jgi:hypothetical protein
MARTVRLGGQTLDYSRFSQPVQWALAAYEEVGAQEWSALRVEVVYRTFFRQLPADASAVVQPLLSLMDLAMDFDPALLSQLPRLRCVHGTVPMDDLGFDAALTALHARAAEEPPAKRHLAACAQFLDHRKQVTAAHKLRCLNAWEAMQEAELIANEMLLAHLNRCDLTLSAQQDRYLAPRYGGASFAPLVSSADFRELVVAVHEAHAAYDSNALSQLKVEKWVVTAAALALAGRAIVDAADRGVIYPDHEESRRLAAALGLATEAQAHLMEATQKYFTVLCAQAARHPLVLQLAPKGVSSDGGVMHFAQEIAETIADSRAAIASLRLQGVAQRVIPAQHADAHAYFPAGIAALVTAADKFSVWKLPFFVERACGHLRPRDASDVDAILALATQTESDQAIGRALLVGGIEFALMKASAAGPIGVGVAMVWGVLSLVNEIHDYQQMQTLFQATIDPQMLLLGLEHEPASKLSVLFAFLGALPVLGK